MSALKHCSRLARIATRKTKYYGLQQIRPISVAPSLIFKNITHQKTFVNGYAQWNPNIVKSRIPDIPLPKVTFTDQVWTKVDRWSDHTALVCGVTGKEVKYSEVRNDCRKFGVALLKELGLKPGEVIATILPNTIEYPSILFGAIEAGIIVTTINPAYTADEIAFQIKDSGAKLAVTFSQKVNTLLEVKEKFGLPDLEIVSTGKDLPENVKSYQNLISNANPDLLKDLKPKKFSSDDTIVIPYSSGTTGKPKGVCLTHQNLISNLVSMEQVGHFQDTSANYQEVIPVVLPMFHIYGMTVVVGQAMSRGAKLIMIPKFDEEMFLRSLKDYKATVLYVAPPLVLYIGNSPKVTKDHLKTLKTILSGAAPVGELDIEKCLKKSPESVEYMQGYGLTETAPAVCSMIHGYKIYSSVGPPVVNTLVKIIDIQTQQALGNNEEGEICVKGPQVMKCYLNNKEATDGVLKDGWFHTGDIGYYDTEGFFYVTDRVKELIKVKGFQVAPAELESVLRSHPDVADAGVIGAPHERHGETPIAFVQIRSGKADEKALKDYLKDKLAKYKQIEKFIFVDSIPKSAAGKILRKELRVQYQNMTK